jgi:hypothetical protein
MIAIFVAAWRVMLKRVRASGLVLTTAFTTILLAITLLAAGPIYANSVYLAALQRTIRDAPTREANLEVSATLHPDVVEQVDEVVSTEIERTFTAGSVAIYRTGVSESYALPHAADAEVTDLTVFRFYDHLEDHANLIDGDWPAVGTGSAAVEAVISEGTALELQLGIGAELPVVNRLDETMAVTAVVSGIYAVDDPLDPYWYANELEVAGVEPGSSFTRYGPLVVNERAFERVFSQRPAAVSWRVIPLIDRMTIDDLPRLRSALPSLEPRIDANAGFDTRITGSVELAIMLGKVERSLLATRSGVLILTVQLAILAGYALVLSAGLLVDQRRTETVLLRSRGAGVRQMLALALMEGVVLTLPAVVAGPFLASWLLRLLNVIGPLAGIGLTLHPQVTRTSFVLGGLAGLAAIVTLALPAIASARASIEGQGGRSRARTRGIWQRGAIDVTLLAVAGLAFYQLRRYGLPLTESVRGRLEVDPLLVAAPAIGLLAGALIALRLVPLLAALAERFTTRRGRPIAVLSAWQVARRPVRYARSALLLILALAIGLFTVSYSSTWRVSQGDQADFQIGADVRVQPNQRPNGIDRAYLASAYRGVDGVTAIMPYWRSFRSIGRSRETADVVQIDADQAASVVRIRDDLTTKPIEDLMEPLIEQRPALATIPVPGEPRRLAIDFKAGAVQGARINLSIVIRDADGFLHRRAGDSVRALDRPERVSIPLHGALPDGSPAAVAYPIEIVAIEFTARSVPEPRIGTFELDGLASSASDDGDDWQPLDAKLEPGAWQFDNGGTFDGLSLLPKIETMSEPEIPEGAVGFRYDAGIAWREFVNVPYRLRLAGSQIPDEIPVLVSRHLLDELAFEVGDTFTMDLVGSGQKLVIAGVLDAFPTLDAEASLFVIVDSETMEAFDLATAGTPFQAPSEYWLAVDDDNAEAAAEALREIPFSSTLVAPQHERARILRTDPVALGMIGALSIGFVAAIVFALIGFVTSAAVSVRERLTEFALLRAIGLSPRQLAGWLLLEHGFLLVVSLVFGTLLGLLLSWLVLPQISVTQAATRAFPSVVIVIPWGTVTLLELAAVTTLVLVSGLLALLLRRIGLGTLLRIGEDA